MGKFPKGGIVRAPRRQLRLVLAAQLLWLGIVCLLGAWWGKLALKQAERIRGLENLLGFASSTAQTQWLRTQRMLYWESATYFTLLLASTLFLFWLYWRDMKRSKSLQAFFAGVTHELRTPLTSIRLQAESIAENTIKESSQRLLVDRLLEDTMRLESQVERTLELARIEGGGVSFAQPLKIRPWLERSLSAWCEAHQQKVEVNSEIKDLAVQADPGALQVVLRNILENSMRHSGKEKVSIELTSEESAEHLVLRFKDDGVGFSGNPKQLGGIFHKGNASQGAGIGLYLVRVLMQRMGGFAEFFTSSGFEVALWFKKGQRDG